MVTKNSLIYSRRTGVFTALGLGCGIIIHVTYSLLGIAFIISRSILLFSIIKYVGAAYLIYIGYKSLRAKKVEAPEELNTQIKQNITNRQAWKQGFITNITNPKVTLFFFSIFMQLIDPATPLFIQIIYGAEMSVVTFLWFAFVAWVLSCSAVKSRFHKVQHYFEKVMGAVLITLGIKVALSSSK